MLTIEDVLRVLPHRYPFLFIDRVVEFDPGERIVAVKNVTVDEPFFAGARSGSLVMPGLLIVEALAQAGGFLLLAQANGGGAENVVYFASLDAVQWHAPVGPGDQLHLHVTVTHARGRLRKVHAEARVRDAVVCEADMAAVVMPR
jgi:beta-hydroxyacyl-ACP dehydratase FabZ